MQAKKVVVDDRMQRGYVYYLTEPEGEHFDASFRPELTPAEMLSLGVFGGKYMTDCRQEFPASWFEGRQAEPGTPRPGTELLRCQCVAAAVLLAAPRDGSIRRILAAGSSGTAAITWAAEARTMPARSAAGKR